MKTNWISSAGQFIEKFETEFAQFCGATEGVSCTNGTVAIHLALRALDIGPGDEVIVPNFTLIVNATMVLQAGARPVLVDVNPDTWCIDPIDLERKITKRTKAIMIVHMYGHPCDMDSIWKIAKQHNLVVIEDAAQSHGAVYKGKRTGSLGDISTFSFYANKIITTGEGGMILTSRKDLADRCRLLRNQAHGHPRYCHEEFGYNYRFSNVLAGIGLAQCRQIEKKVARKREIAQIYLKLLKGNPHLQLPTEADQVQNVFWMFGVVLRGGLSEKRDQIMQSLSEVGVETRAFFYPLHRQPLFASGRYDINVSGSFPISDLLGRSGFYLPSGLALTRAQQEYVVESLSRCLQL